MKTFFKLILIVIIFPLGLISKGLYLIHMSINNILIRYKNYINENKVEIWTTLLNAESKDLSWEIINQKNGNVQLLYFPDPSNDGNPEIIILSTKEFVDLLDFTKTLTKLVDNDIK